MTRSSRPKCVASDKLSGLSTCLISQRKSGRTWRVKAYARDAAGQSTTVTLVYKVKR